MSTNSSIILTLGALLALGSAARFVPTDASAEEFDAEETKGTADTPGASGASSAGASANDPGICFTGEAAERLRADKEMIDARIAELQSEEIRLQARSRELDAQFAELESLQLSLESRWEELIQTANDDVRQLSMMYASMKPQEAGEIFSRMDPAFAAGFLRQIPSDQAGQILASIDPDKAYAISLILASRNADIRRTQGAEP